MGGSYMAPMTQRHMMFDAITLGFLEDSGWYKPVYTVSEDMWWGKDRGCAFAENMTCHYQNWFADNGSMVIGYANGTTAGCQSSVQNCPMGDIQSNKTGEFCNFTDVK